MNDAFLGDCLHRSACINRFKGRTAFEFAVTAAVFCFSYRCGLRMVSIHAKALTGSRSHWIDFVGSTPLGSIVIKKRARQDSNLRQSA